MINILIIEDSATETLILKKIFELAFDLRVIGCAKNGKEGVELAKRLKPNIISMDIQMPVMDGIEAIHKIMAECPTPIVVISSKLNNTVMNLTFRALEAGALSVIEKPSDITTPHSEIEHKRMIEIIRSMSEIKVIKRRFLTHVPVISSKNSSEYLSHRNDYEIIAIGTSVGGPLVLKKILSQLPKTFSIPIVVVQHMTPGFIAGLTNWLNDITPLTVKEAHHNELLLKGTVYFAPDNCHLEIDKIQGKILAKLIQTPPVSGFCPSASVLLESVAKHCGKHAIGMLLTGMGNDGAQGLLSLKKARGHTLIQDPNSAIVFGMAGVAQTLGAVDKVIELEKIAEYLISITQKTMHKVEY